MEERIAGHRAENTVPAVLRTTKKDRCLEDAQAPAASEEGKSLPWNGDSLLTVFPFVQLQLPRNTSIYIKFDMKCITTQNE